MSKISQLEMRLDLLLLNRVRFAILNRLAHAGEASFTDLRNNCQVSDGSVGAHLWKLEKAGYVTVQKSFVDRRPVTRACLTNLGWHKIRTFSDSMSTILADLQPLIERANLDEIQTHIEVSRHTTERL